MKRISKALGAAAGGGIAGVGVYLQSHSFHMDSATLAGAAGAFVTAAILAFVAAYWAPANRP